jgi:hypothetical protein
LFKRVPWYDSKGWNGDEILKQERAARKAFFPDLASFAALRIMGGRQGSPNASFPHRQAREGTLADKSTQLILDALTRAAGEPAGVPLHGTKAVQGLFPASTQGKQAGRRCLDEGLIQLTRTETRGKATVDVCALSDKGLNYLLSQVSPKEVLEDLVRVLEARQTQVDELIATAQQVHSSVEALKAAAEHVLKQLRTHPTPVAGAPANGDDLWTGTILNHLAGWHQARKSEDCPLPELYQKARQATPSLTVGHFHDGLRLLHDQGQIYLHPWTGPLCDIPEPPYALLVGHQIAYYASKKCA